MSANTSTLFSALVSVLITAVLAPALLQAQIAERPMTNREVIGLVKLRVPDETVVLAIKGGPTSFDLSDSALERLRINGVSESVVAAMRLSAGRTGPLSSATSRSREKLENTDSSVPSQPTTIQGGPSRPITLDALNLQPASDCHYKVSNQLSDQRHPSAGSKAVLFVSTSPGCQGKPWIASSFCDFVSMESDPWAGRLVYIVSPNPLRTIRVCTLGVADTVITVTQEGSGDGASGALLTPAGPSGAMLPSPGSPRGDSSNQADDELLKRFFGETPGPPIGVVSPRSQASLPTFSRTFKGRNEIRVKNPNAYSVQVQLRTGSEAQNFTVAPQQVASAYGPDGEYEIYFIYSSEPDALYQGDNFTLSGNGVQIDLVAVIDGNYGVRRVPKPRLR